jgi:hypothetical protein
MSDVLDQTLPPELQNKVVAAKATQTQVTQETQMPELIPGTLLNAPAAITPDQVKAMATEAAKALLAQKDADQAVASNIEKLTNDANTSKAELAKAVANLASLQTQIDGFTKQVATLTTDKDAVTKKLAETEAAKASLQAIINKAAADKAVATRTESLTKVGASKDTIAQFVTIGEDGTLKVNDESFTQTLAILNSVYEAGKASIPAPATAPATVPATVPAAAVPAQAVAAATPVAPDLNNMEQFAQATAALVNGGGLAPTVSGRAAYADAFKE